MPCHAIALAQQPQQDVLGTDISMLKCLGLLGGKREHFLYAWCVRDVADRHPVRACADLPLDFRTHGFQTQSQFLKHVYGDTLTQFDQTEQYMLGADETVIETVRLFPRQRQHLLCSRRKIPHRLRLGAALGGCSRSPEYGRRGEKPAEKSFMLLSRTLRRRSSRPVIQSD